MHRRSFLYAAASGLLLQTFAPRLLAAPAEPLIAVQFGQFPPGDQVRRIASAGPLADVMLISLVPDKLLGISTHNIPESRKKFFPESVRHLPNTGRIAGRGTTFPMESLLALQPDLILDLGNTSDTYTSTAERVFQQTGIPYLVMSGRLDASGEQLRTLGEMLGAAERGQTLGRFADRVLADARRLREQTAAHPVRVFFGRSADGLETGLSGSIHAEVIDTVGGYNVAAAAGKELLARVSMEQLIQWDPDVILTQDANYFERLRHDPLWKDLRAVQTGRIYLAPTMPFGWLDHPPGINRLLGILWCTHVFHPEVLPLARYEAAVAEYFELFYGYRLAPGELATLDHRAALTGG
ncbi:iron ABC transporter substrate-binding protein [Alcaligenaceae bacterium SJ-26]|nr:iron ABC transporter substrate-binding protein [Alcaligenaceae bacterium SJ-26]